MTDERALLQLWPSLRDKLRFSRLGDFPTPVHALSSVAAAIGHPEAELYEKRDDLSSPIYGGNKVRTLEVLFGKALDDGASHIYSTGAYGSNHAAASALHAPRVGLVPGALLYPQPHSKAALDNLEMLVSRTATEQLRDLPHWSALPLGMWQQQRASRRRGERAVIMVPGGAVPLGALGYVSAALELASQVDRGELPRPRQVVVAAGSNCTSAGLLLGFALAARLGIGLHDRGRPAAPRLVSVRVTPWPVTSPLRIVSLATRTAALLAELTGDPSLALSWRTLRASLKLDAGYIGPGYGFSTDAGRDAMRLWSAHAGHELETTYSGKAAACLLDLARAREPGPLLYWSTKTSAELPKPDPHALALASPRMRRWMKRARSS
jgi:D-cysteine desulfhydrase